MWLWKRGTKLESLALESDCRSESLPSSESKRSVSVRKKIEGKKEMNERNSRRKDEMLYFWKRWGRGSGWVLVSRFSLWRRMRREWQKSQGLPFRSRAGSDSRRFYSVGAIDHRSNSLRWWRWATTSGVTVFWVKCTHRMSWLAGLWNSI